MKQRQIHFLPEEIITSRKSQASQLDCQVRLGACALLVTKSLAFSLSNFDTCKPLNFI